MRAARWSKFSSYISALACAVANGGFGINLLPGQADRLVQTFRDLAQDRQRLSQWGANGREYVKRFDQRKLLADFFERLKRVHTGGTRSVASE